MRLQDDDSKFHSLKLGLLIGWLEDCGAGVVAASYAPGYVGRHEEPGLALVEDHDDFHIGYKNI